MTGTQRTAPESADAPLGTIRAALVTALELLASTDATSRARAGRLIGQAAASFRSAPAERAALPSTSGRPIQALEQEHRRLARDIHDGPAQVLATLAMHAEVIERLIGVDDARAAEEVRQLRQEALAAAEEVRQMIFQLVPPGLMQRDLAAVLAEHVRRLRDRYGMEVALDIPADLPVGKEAQATVFRVVQEALQNALHHSESIEAWVSIRPEGRALVAEIWDRGRGFDPGDPALQDGRHLGIAGMRERAEIAGGTLLIDSRPGGGTRVTLRLAL